MKAPEFIQLASAYWPSMEDKKLSDIKEGDSVFISFGKARARRIEFKVVMKNSWTIEVERKDTLDRSK